MCYCFGLFGYCFVFERMSNNCELDEELRESVEILFGKLALGELDDLRTLRDRLLDEQKKVKKDDLTAGRKFLIEEINFIENIVTRWAKLHDFLHEMSNVLEGTERFILKGYKC